MYWRQTEQLGTKTMERDRATGLNLKCIGDRRNNWFLKQWLQSVSEMDR